VPLASVGNDNLGDRERAIGDSVRLFKLSTMSDFRTCELCDVVFNAHMSNAATDPHRCEPAALVARILALKEALKSERKRSQPKQGCGHRSIARFTILLGFRADRAIVVECPPLKCIWPRRWKGRSVAKLKIDNNQSSIGSRSW